MKTMSLFAGSIITLLLVNSCSEMPNHKPPRQLITNELAKSLNQKYLTDRSTIIEEDIQQQDANAFWYSIEELENYIYYAKCEAEKNNKKLSGFRIYLGVYPNDTITYAEKSGLTTAFLSPTVKRNSNSSTAERTTTVNTEENIDENTIQPLNFGHMGNPPKMSYPTEN